MSVDLAQHGQPANYNATPGTRTDGAPSGLEVDSRGNLKITEQCNMTEVDLATDADVVVTASPAVLMGVSVNVVMSAHAALIKDNTTTKITLAASTAAGVNLDTHGAIFATNITVESDNAATGKLLIFWKPL